MYKQHSQGFPSSFFQMWWLVAILSVGLVHCQSNYEIQAPSTNYTLYNTIEDEGALPSFVTLNGTVHDLDSLPATVLLLFKISCLFILSRYYFFLPILCLHFQVMLKKTKAVLNCSAGYMHVGMTFNKPFYGIVYADYDRNSACKMHGDGQTQGTIKLPLKGCGTVQVSTYFTYKPTDFCGITYHILTFKIVFPIFRALPGFSKTTSL